MATNSEVIRAQADEWGVQIKDVLLEKYAVDAEMTLTDVYSKDNQTPVTKVLALILKSLLSKPDISEGQLSIKYDRETILAYYGTLCKELGIENQFATAQPIIQNQSYRW